MKDSILEKLGSSIVRYVEKFRKGNNMSGLKIT